MDINKLAKDIQAAIESLRGEQEEIDAKIAAMEDALKSLGERAPTAARRGRPPKAASTASVATAKGSRSRKKPHWSDDARKAAAERMRKYWEERKGSPKKASKKKSTKKKAGKRRVAKKSVSAKKAAAAAAAE
ncbi:MAG: hypothetical protein AAFN74_12475 [Myxococcota bacterium]